jgi:predicted lipoprotein
MRPALFSFCVLGAALSCSGDGGDSSPDAAPIDFDHSAMLDNYASNVVLPTYETFNVDATALTAAVTAYCAALGTADESARLDDTRAAWTAAIDSWQVAELMTIGPASKDGAGLRDLIYSFPLISGCAVDGEVVELRNDPNGYDISDNLTNRRGLASLEYVLFSTTLDSVCGTAPDGWDPLADADKRAARCAFAERASADVSTQAQALVTAWHPDGDNFAGDLASAGQSGSSFAELDDGMNAVFGAVFYLDTQTKDEKLGKPTGQLTNGCGAVNEACPDALESRFARRSKENLAANLRGFEMMWLGNAPDGTEGPGFDDYLRALGAGELADRFEANITAARSAVDALPGALIDLLGSDFQAVVSAHAAIREITTPLKQEAPNLLRLEIPNEAGGDTD